ncbi:MAG: urea ABC transporter ATP-binding protein UrtD [Thioalkalivibrionaceae bacterium]
MTVANAQDRFRRDRVFDFLLPKPDFSEAGVPAGQPILYLEDVTVSFDGFRALDALNLSIDAGELRCVIGPNGAGKTTMMDVITGKTRPDAGSIHFGRGLDLQRLPEYAIARGGIGRKFQKPTVFDALSVFDNLALSADSNKSTWASLRFRLSGEAIDRLDWVLATIGLESAARSLAGQLSHGQKQWLEIGMLLMQRPRILLVDEPVAGMTPQEAERTAELMTDLAGRHTVIVVEHDMAFVRSIARRVSVLHQGCVIAEGSMDFVAAHPKVVEVYLGETQ